MKISSCLLLILAFTYLILANDTLEPSSFNGNFDSTAAASQAATNSKKTSTNNPPTNTQSTGNTQGPSKANKEQSQLTKEPQTPQPPQPTNGQDNEPILKDSTNFQTESEDQQNVKAAETNKATGSIQSPKILLSQINKPILSKGYKADKGISYQRIKVTDLSKKYLFFNFKLAEKDQWQHVNITITNEGDSKILNICGYTGLDSCYVPAFTLRPESVLFVTVQCQDDCTYNLNAQWSDTQHLAPGEDVIFMFGKDTTQIYHVELDGQKDFEEVRIHLAPRVTRRPFDNVKIYGKYGSNAVPTPQSYDFKSINLWEDGQGIFIKKQKLKEKKFVLFIVGQSQTTYKLSLQLVREQNHEIENGEHIYEYLQSKQEQTYHIKSNPGVFEQYSLRFSILSGGNLSISFFSDKELKNALQMHPIEYMKDSQYILQQKEMLQEYKDGLYIKIKTAERDATFTLKFVGRNKADSIQLNEHVYGFIFFEQSRFAHFDFKRWAQETQNRQGLKFTANIMDVMGTIKTQFFICQSTLGLCTNPKFYQNSTLPIKATNQGDFSQKKVYELSIQDNLLKKINAAEQQATIVVKFTNLKPFTAQQKQRKKFNLVAIQLMNNNKVLYLREGRPLEEKLGQRQMKIYKYINSDPNVKEIRIHLNEIAGHITFGGVVQGEDQTKSVQIIPQASTLRFTTNLTRPIYVSVVAQSKAIFGISMQVIHKSSEAAENIISISQDLTYHSKIQPNQFAIYQVTPIYYDFYFTYAASQSVIVCAINPKTNSCIDPNGDSLPTPKLSVKGTIDRATLQNRKARVKITNPFGDSAAQVSFIFHSRRLSHCDDKVIGTIYNEVVKDKACFSYPIRQDNKTVDLYISKREFASLTYTVMICGNALPYAISIKTLEITPAILNQKCANSSEAKKISIIWSVNTQNAFKDEKSVKVDFLAQYRGQVVVLTEGVSYSKAAKITQGGFLGKYAYNLINKKDTKVILNQIRGRFIVYAKVVEESRKQVEQISNINYEFVSSQTVDYSQEPLILISGAEIKKYGCIDCSVLVAVYSHEDYGSQVQFDIEIVQKYHELNEDTAVDGYLQAGSFAYYTYAERSQDNSTILILLSDHNQQCANMYLSLMQNPGPSSHIAKSIGANQLIFRHAAGEKKYYLSVEATKICDYSISVLTIDSSIHNLKRGKQNIIKFAQGITKYFYIDHYTNEPFKIVTLSRYGEIKMYLNKSQIMVNKKSFTTSELALQNFQYKSERSNTLYIDDKNPLFCEKCSYFLAIKALKNTQATLYLVYPQTIITLTEGHFLSDYLPKKDDYTLAKYNHLQKTQINIKVYSGSVNIMAVYKETTLSRKFQPDNNVQTYNLDFQSQQKKVQKPLPQADPYLGQKQPQAAAPAIQRIPINLMILATAPNTSYTLQMKSLANQSNLNSLATYQSILAGEPNSIEVSASKALCLTGFLRNIDEELILSANNQNRAYFGDIIMQASINNQKAQITKTFTKNIMGIRLSAQKKKLTSSLKNSFELCLKLKEQQSPKQKETKEDSVKEVQNDEGQQAVFKGSITQSNTVNILPIDVDSVVKGQSTFVIHSDGQFLLDVFQCNGQAKVNYGNSLESIEKGKFKMLDMINMPDQRHAIRVSQKQTTFVTIKSPHSIVKWLPIDYENERGLGYIRYSSGDLKYSSKFKEISIEYQPLQKNKESRSTINELQYLLYISNSSESIEFASQCETTTSDVQVISLVAPPLSSSEYLSKILEKEQLQKIYPGSQNIYFNVVAKLSLKVPASDETTSLKSSDEHEHYKFIYSRQQIPLQNYKQNQLQSIPYHFLILVVVSIGAILFICTYLFTRKIVPLIARLKNSNLVEQQPPQEHKDDLQVPASSDRNQRAPDVAVETEEKMGH